MRAARREQHVGYIANRWTEYSDNSVVQCGRASVEFAVMMTFIEILLHNVNDVYWARMVCRSGVYGESGAIAVDRGKRRCSFGRRICHFHGQLTSPTRNATLGLREI